ncbi:MAG TPA: hypothetical protein VFT98_22025 [Myxococcota bacterium]|nr:hypothetical protein [Myxococcota bacterium]
MIYALARDIDAELRTRGVPFPVLYGPEGRTTTALTRNRIVIERPRERGADSTSGPRSQHNNPGIVNVRAVAAVVRIFAQSTVAGAAVQDHEDLADAAADMFEAALYKVTKSAKWRTLYTLPAWGLLGQAELQLLELTTWNGVVYEARFTVDRGVKNALTWTAPSRPEKEFGVGADKVGITSTTQVTINGQGSPETGCG